MREILFRAKETFNGEWVEGYYEFGYDAETEEPTHYMWVLNHTEKYGDMFMVIPETVGQYTGLTDKNGKKIFEGDIHERDGHYFVVKHGKFESFENSDIRYGWYFEAIKGDVTEEFYGDEEKYVNIIGNIHDNPELLE